MAVFSMDRFRICLLGQVFVKISSSFPERINYTPSSRFESGTDFKYVMIGRSERLVLFFPDSLFLNLSSTLSTRSSVNLEFKVDRTLLLSIPYSAAWNLLPFNYNSTFY